MTHPTLQVQSNSQITDIPLTETQRLRLKDDLTSLRFFKLPLGIGPSDRGQKGVSVYWHEPQSHQKHK